MCPAIVKRIVVGGAGLAIAAIAAAGSGPTWVTFIDDTAGRLAAPPTLGRDDVEQKTYAAADFDQDGDVDLVVARKQPWSAPGRRTNVLLMNEDGVLTDRTHAFASAADDGGAGFLDPTNDRGVTTADVNDDGWIDVVTAAFLGDGLPKTISHPRIYVNLGADESGTWLGFRYEEARIPQLEREGAPRFTAVAAGDVTGDGLDDLYFVDTDLGGPQDVDFNDRLLINVGAGFFFDDTAERMTEEMTVTSFAHSAAIVDMNGDGAADIVRSSNGFPTMGVTIAYNDAEDIGAFHVIDVVYTGSPTFVSAADLNDDALPDLVVTDDGADRFLINLGNDADGFAQFSSFVIPNSSGFGGDSAVADLNGDDLVDILITDIDWEIPGCNRVTGLHQNISDGGPAAFAGPDGGTISNDELRGVHDAAVLDVDGDGRPDLVFGRCDGTRVYLNRTTCLGDFNDDAAVDAADLAILLSLWGVCDFCPEDFDANGLINAADLAVLLNAWGDC